MASFLTALDIEPGFVECRRALRRAQASAGRSCKGRWNSTLRNIRLSPALTKLQVISHFQPLKSIAAAERILDQDPANKLAHEKLAGCAMRLNLPRTAALSLEVLAGEHPEHCAYKLELAEALAKNGDTSKAAMIYGQLLKEHPNDGAVQRAFQKMAATIAIAEAPAQPEPQAISVTGTAMPPPPAKKETKPAPAGNGEDAIIKRFEALLAHGPNNVKFLTTLGAAYATKGMFDKSLGYYQRALSAFGGKNQHIEAAIEGVTAKKFAAELNGIDDKSPESAALREKILDKQLDYQWRKRAATSDIPFITHFP